MHRFFVPPESVQDGHVTISGTLSHRIARVLRARAGDTIAVLDDSGWEYLVALKAVSPRQATGAVIERRRPPDEPRVVVTLYQGVLKGEKFELVLEKGTELGVSGFVPIVCTRSVPRWEENARDRGRRARWRRILTEAAEQSRRGRVPALKTLVDFEEGCRSAMGIGVMPFEEEKGRGLKEALQQAADGHVSAVSVFVGSEGGFTRDEVDYALSMGIVPVTLGGRILRAETASLATVAAVMYELGEMGSSSGGG